MFGPSIVLAALLAQAPASGQSWRRSLESLPAQPAPTTNADDVNRVGSALADANPYLLSGGPDNYEINRELVRRTTAYLMAVEVMARDPEMRLAMSRAYRELGDLQARSGGRFGSRGEAARSYRRAGMLIGNMAAMQAGVDSIMLDRELARLGSRLATLEGSGGSPTAGPANPVPPFALQPRQMKDVPAAQRVAYEDVADRYVNAAARAAIAWENIEGLRRRLESDGMTLNTELAAGVSRMQLFLQLAVANMEEKDWSGAQQNIERAEYQTGKVLKFVGR